jgi:hypothetical protein
MAKYRDGKAGIRGHENRTIWFPKTDHSVSLGQVGTFTTGSSSNDQSRAPLQQNSEGRSHRQQEHHPMPYFPIRPPMPRSWGPPSMTYPSYPPWVGWYGPWTPPAMHFYPGWSRPTQGFGHRGYYTRDSRYESVGHQLDRKTSRQENWTVWNAKPDHLVSPTATTAYGQ